MLRLKKRAAAVLAAISLVSLLGGCGSGAAKDTSKNKGAVEIEFWYGLGGKLGKNVEEAIKEFNSSQNEVIVKGIAQESYKASYQALQAAIAAKKAPAVVLLKNEQAAPLASKNVLAPLDEFIEKDKDFKPEDFIPSFYEGCKIKGKQYGVPMYGTTQVMYYRKDFFKDAGISEDVLNTWEDLTEAAKKLTKKNGENVAVYGWEPMYGKDNLIDIAQSNGGKIISDDGKTVMIDSKEWIDSWEMVRKAIFEDKTMRIHSGGQGWQYWYDTIDDVMKDRAAGYIGSSGDQGDLDFSKIAAHIQPGFKNHKASPVALAHSMYVPAITTADKKAAAFKWMKFFTSSKNTAKWSIKTGYIAVRKSASEDPEFKSFAEKNPQVLVPVKQASIAAGQFIDPTDGKILDAINKAADKVEIEGLSAEKALKEAKEIAQKELDSVNKK